MSEVLLQPAWVLHTRPYRDTSLLVDVLTLAQGRLSLVAKGARQASRSAKVKGSALTPFAPLLISYAGRSELKTLRQVESQSNPLRLVGQRLYSGLYMNELLYRMLPSDDGSADIFPHYSHTLSALAGGDDIEPLLRQFEWHLLSSLGYAVDIEHDGASGEPVHAQTYYCFEPERGMVAATADTSQQRFSGQALLALANGEDSDELRRAHKALMRVMLAVHLGDTPLHSRSLFRASGGQS